MFKFNEKTKTNKGMSYVELIVVLSIFALLSSVAVYNYGDFQSNVDMKNLASDIASKIVEAQKSALNGVLPGGVAPFAAWKPSYGVSFDTSVANDSDGKPFNTKFIYFVDLDNAGNRETLETVNITKNNKISRIDKCTENSCPPVDSDSISSLAVFFKRPDSSANFAGAEVSGSEYIKITIESPKKTTAFIKIYPSGRIQVN